MGLWKNILRVFGLSDQVRVRIDAPGIDVVLTGDPHRVRALLSVVREELEKNPNMLSPKRGRRRRRQAQVASRSQIVQPTELDEMDSPYALPEAVVMPVQDEEVTNERMHIYRRSTLTPVNKPVGGRDMATPDTLLPPMTFTESGEQTISSIDGGDEPESEATALAPIPKNER